MPQRKMLPPESGVYRPLGNLVIWMCAELVLVILAFIAPFGGFPLEGKLIVGISFAAALTFTFYKVVRYAYELLWFVALEKRMLAAPPSVHTDRTPQ